MVRNAEATFVSKSSGQQLIYIRHDDMQMFLLTQMGRDIWKHPALEDKIHQESEMSWI